MTFDDAQHPRGQAANAGQFRAKANTAPSGALDALDADGLAHAARELDFDYLDESLNDAALERVRAVGEMPDARARLAQESTDPFVLAVLAQETTSYAPEHVARSGFATPATLHYLATNDDRSHQPHTRGLALENPNVAEITLRHAWSKRRSTSEATHAAHSVLYNDRAPADIVDEAFAERYGIAGRHPNLPQETLDRAIIDPDRAIDVIEHPRLTAEQLDAATRIDYAAAYADGRGTLEEPTEEHEVICYNVAVHPNVSVESLGRLAKHYDSHIARTARSRLTASIDQSSAVTA